MLILACKNQAVIVINIIVIVIIIIIIIIIIIMRRPKELVTYYSIIIYIRHDNVIDLMMKITGRIIFKTTFGCPHDTIIRSNYNI